MNLFSYFKPSTKGMQRVSAIQRVAGIPGVDHLSAVAALEASGFWVLREGDHFVMTDGTRVLTIPRNDPVNALTMDGIVRDAGLTVDKFRELC
jgi:predicted RNA binding protein YcfA (HicA-like mRNA interferase family)